MSIRSADLPEPLRALAAQQPLALSATAFLREHHRELITIRDLADHLSYSPSHLTRSFTAAVGVSPIRYLSSWRLHEAKHLLISEGLDVAEACYEVGYTSVGTFSRRFVRDVGLPPADGPAGLPMLPETLLYVMPSSVTSIEFDPTFSVYVFPCSTPGALTSTQAKPFCAT